MGSYDRTDFERSSASQRQELRLKFKYGRAVTEDVMDIIVSPELRCPARRSKISYVIFVGGVSVIHRLRDLERRGVLTRTVMPTSPPTVEYRLTALGEELLPAIRSIVEVGSRLPLRDAAPATA